jgi:threonine dehydrogenase-like Zn-dependent dehydrogenase
MRWSLLGIAALLGAFSITLIGGGTACVATDAGTGGTAAASSSTGVVCDSLGQGCDVCQECAGSVTCAAQLAACQADEGCQTIATCVDSLQGAGATDLTSCCGPESEQFPPGSLSWITYEAAATCVFESQCLYSCYGKFYACNL